MGCWVQEIRDTATKTITLQVNKSKTEMKLHVKSEHASNFSTNV